MIVRNSEMKKKMPSRAQREAAAIPGTGNEQIAPKSSKGSGKSRKPRKTASEKKASTATAVAAATDQTGKPAKPKSPKKPKSDGARRDTKSKSKDPGLSQPESSAAVALKSAPANPQNSKPAKRRPRSSAAPPKTEAKSASSPAEANPQTPSPQPQTLQARPKKKLSFFAWLFRKRAPSPAPEDAYDNIIQIAAAKFVEASPANGVDDAPITPSPRLMAKLSGLGDDAPDLESDGETARSDEGDENMGEESSVAGASAESDTEDADEPGPLTLRLLEFQRKIEPKTPKIRSFP